MKWIRDTDGNRRSSAIVNTSGRSTRPWITSSCFAGSIAGTPLWWRSKWSDDGVMIPSESCSGVRLELVAGVSEAALNERAAVSKVERAP